MFKYLMPALASFIFAQKVSAQDIKDFTVKGNDPYKETNLEFKKGDTMFIKTTGNVSFGLFIGKADAFGFNEPVLRMYNKQNEQGDVFLSHGALLIRRSSKESAKTIEYGQTKALENCPDWRWVKFTENGTISFSINDTKTSDNSGAFQVLVSKKRPACTPSGNDAPF
jgi:hypothetical protein